MSAISSLARHYVEQRCFCSIEYLLSLDRQQVDQGRFGTFDADGKDPLPANPLYRIYSMTKPMISVAALMLIERQQLRLYDPLVNYLPEFANQQVLNAGQGLQRRTTEITIEHLLTHRAGLSYDFLPDCPVGARYREQHLVDDGRRSLASLVSILAGLPLASQPGEQWRYSYATDVLARVIEVVTGQRIDAFLAQNLIDPLDMQDTGYRIPPGRQSRLLPMYGAQSVSEIMTPPDGQQTLRPTDLSESHPVDDPDFRRGGHGLYSTVGDYMKFAEFLLDGVTDDGERLLSEPMHAMMWNNRINSELMPLSIGPNYFPGYGWNLFGRVMVDTGQAMWLTGPGEGGWSGAASTYFWVDPGRSFCGVVMTQYLGSVIPLGINMLSAAYSSLDQLWSDE